MSSVFYRTHSCADLDNAGRVVVRYIYDAWGNHKVYNPDGTENTSSTFIGNINPFRYRGYFYDTETGLYYLKTRYYDPETGRFISPDSIEYADPESLSGLNLYAIATGICALPVPGARAVGTVMALLVLFIDIFK